jgi:hypothetical protein
MTNTFVCAGHRIGESTDLDGLVPFALTGCDESFSAPSRWCPRIDLAGRGPADDLGAHFVLERRRVARRWTALGTTCDGCHVKGLTAESSDEELELQRSDGTPIYCDACHQGHMTFLDRTDKDALATWMQQNFVDGLARKDGAIQLCATCHGQSANRAFLDAWRLP